MPHAELDGVRLHYEFDGAEDAPVLVLSNSIGSDLSMWDAVAPHFARRFHVLRYDTRGHGASSVPPGPYSIDELGKDVVALLDALGIERANFCGLSMGGITGVWLGLNAPDRVEKLVLANTAARIGTREMWNQRIAAVSQGGLAAMTEMILERWFTPQFRQRSPATMERVMQMISGNSAEGYAHCCAALREADLRSELAKISTAALVIAGVTDPATTPADGRFLAQHLPWAEYVELETSHLSAIEDPQAFCAAVGGFLGAEET